MNKKILFFLILITIPIYADCRDSLESYNNSVSNSYEIKTSNLNTTPKGLKKQYLIGIKSPHFTKGGAETGGRSKGAILRILMQNFPFIRSEYKNRLEKVGTCKGEISVKVTIDYSGNVIACCIDSSSINDQILEESIVDIFLRFKFQEISDIKDTTKIVFPLLFKK